MTLIGSLFCGSLTFLIRDDMNATSYKRYALSEAEKNDRSLQSLSAIDDGLVFEDDEIADFFEKLDSICGLEKSVAQ